MKNKKSEGKFSHFYNEKGDYTIAYDVNGENETIIAFNKSMYAAVAMCDILNHILQSLQPAKDNVQVSIPSDSEIDEMFPITAFYDRITNENHMQMRRGAKVLRNKLLSSQPQEDKWVSVETPPKLGGEYNVVWNLEDNQYPVVSSMDYDALGKNWTDPRRDNAIVNDQILFYQELPEPKKDIPKKIWNTEAAYNDRSVYGHCLHGENMTTCYECNTLLPSPPKVADSKEKGEYVQNATEAD